MSFELENKEYTWYFSVDAWLSNFCHGFSNPFGIFSSKMESLRKRENVRVKEEGEKKWRLGENIG